MDRNAVKEFARQIIVECAPGELELFDSTADLLLKDLPRAVAGDPRRDQPTASGLEVMLPDMVKLALYLADHLISASIEAAAAITGESMVRRRRERKKATAGPRPLIEIQVNHQVRDEARVEVLAIVDGRGFPVEPGQAASLVVYVASHPISGNPPDNGQSQPDSK
jgi:hypothetical protein